MHHPVVMDDHDLVYLVLKPRVFVVYSHLSHENSQQLIDDLSNEVFPTAISDRQIRHEIDGPLG